VITIIDRSKAFAKKSATRTDRALFNMAKDIETLAKTKKVPVDKSHLQSKIEHKKMSARHYRVEVDAPYARFQEFGGDNKRRVKNYTKPGTGAHYLRDSGNIIKKAAVHYIKMQTQLISYSKGNVIKLRGKTL
jgi:hypothetical protein